MRSAELTRSTKETKISVELNLDGKGDSQISTGIGFFDHMLETFAKHSKIDLSLRTAGDLRVDGHHTVEDTGIALGQAFSKALGGDYKGLARFGSSFIPMDDSLGFAAVDICNRPFLYFEAKFISEMIGEFNTCLTEEFFRAFVFNAYITLHLRLIYGFNDHHSVEALFKAFAHSLKIAKTVEGGDILSTKGVL